MSEARRPLRSVRVSGLGAVAVVGLAALLTVGGCATKDAKASGSAEVPSLAQGAAPTASGKADDKRARLRVDMTNEEYDRAMAPYEKCRVDNGLITMKNPKAEYQDNKEKLESPEYQALTVKIETICGGLRPLPPWERDKNNPESLDYLQRVVKCMRDAGAKNVKVEPAEGAEDENENSYSWGKDDGFTLEQGQALTSKCERESVR